MRPAYRVMRLLKENRRFGVALAIVFALFAETTVLLADATDDRLTDFLGAQGCAIGSSTRDAARMAGFTDDALDNLVNRARVAGTATITGDWTVLPPELCKIHPPEVVSQVKRTDPEVIRNLSRRDTFAADGGIGCFLDSEAFQRDLQVTRGWTKEQSFAEYLRFVSAGLRLGEIAFYSESDLRTPRGFAVLGGECAELPFGAEMIHDHAFMIQNFDALMRVSMGAALCRDGEGPAAEDLGEAVRQLSDGTVTNAWLWFEVWIIAYGGGWYDGVGAQRKGMPRPPVCHFE